MSICPRLRSVPACSAQLLSLPTRILTPHDRTAGSNEPRDADMAILTNKIVAEVCPRRSRAGKRRDARSLGNRLTCIRTCAQEHDLDKRNTILSKLKEIPGMVLFVPWFCMYQGVCKIPRPFRIYCPAIQPLSATERTEIKDSSHSLPLPGWVTRKLAKKASAQVIPAAACDSCL